MLTTIFNWIFVYPCCILLFIFLGIPGLIITTILLCSPLIILMALITVFIESMVGEENK